MKRFFSIMLSVVMLCGMLLPVLVYADDENNAQEFSIENLQDGGVNITSDLDGDGQDDNISITETYVEWHLHQTNIKINDQDYTMDADPSWIGQIYLIDLNKDDKTKELLISETYHGRSVYAVIRYENNNIMPLNILSDSERKIFTQGKEDSANIYTSGNGVMKICGVSTFENKERVYTEDRYKETTRGTLVKLDENVTPWETGEYEAEMIIGDYIFYGGPLMDENGIDQHDGIYALNVYNSATRTDKTLLYRGYGLRRIGNKLFAFSGISSGSWDRNLYCFDLNGENIQKITNGVDMQFAMSDEPFTIFNDRIYVGHCSDMEHFEVISFDLDGTDIRIEVPSVYSTEWDCELYDGYAIIDGIKYNYQSSSDNIKVVLNQKELSFDNPPRIINGRTLVPMRAIFEAMEAVVSWDGTSQTVTAAYNGITIKLTIGEGKLYVNGTAKELDVPAQLINNTTYVPVRVIAEAFDADVSWDQNTRTVSINSELPSATASPKVSSESAINNDINTLLQFRRVQMVNDMMYVTPQAATNGGIIFGDGNVTTKVLPCYNEKTDIYSFAIYNDKIYYISAPFASDIAHAILCECDIYGNNVIELCDNVNNYSHAFISNGYIYYDTVSQTDAEDDVTETQYAMDGIYRVNISSHTVEKVVNKPNARLGLVDNEHLFYNHKERNYYCALDGGDDTLSAERDDRCGTITIPGYVGVPGSNKVYYISHGSVYESDLNSYSDGIYITNADENTELVGVDSDNIYYTKRVQNGNGGIAYIYAYPIKTSDDENIIVKVNNTIIDFDQPPIIYNDRTLVPLRAIFEALDAAVAWDDNTRTVTAVRDGVAVKFAIDAYQFYKNGEAIDLDVPSIIVNDRTLVPVRAISEAFGCIVDWDGDMKQVIIRSNNDYEHNDSDFAEVLSEGTYLELGIHPHFKSPLKWIVLSIENDTALLLADTTYCALLFGSDYSSVDGFLKSIYKEAFNDTERSRIKTTFINDLNSEEKLFVLSENEYKEFAWWTNYSDYVLRYKGENTLYIDNAGVSNKPVGHWLYVRPACYIDLKHIKSYSGDGSKVYSSYKVQW